MTSALDPFRRWAELPNLAVLDSETTGLHGQIVELGIVNGNGETLFSERIKPTCKVEPGAQAIHGITDADLEGLPGMPAHWERLSEIFTTHHVLVYNRSFDPRWGVEALFPARVLVRRNLSPASLLFAGYEVASNNYNLHLRNAFAAPNNPRVTSLELRQIDLKFRLRYEHELLSFLWTGVEAGYRYNYQLNAFDRTNNARDRLINSQLGGTPYASLDLFIVPPRKLLQKAERSRK